MKGAQNKVIPSKRLINCRGRLVNLSTPRVMGIVNLTPDSFFDGGKLGDMDSILHLAEKYLNEGATFLDLGAVSTRPKAADVSQDEELQRLMPALEAVRTAFPEAVISVDTFRSNVAREAVQAGADIINDISGGTLDEHMFDTVAALQVPYVLMHMQGTPQTMQADPVYGDVVREVLDSLIGRAYALRQRGLHDIIIDPGFGFGKTLEHNFALLRNLDQFCKTGYPILAGISRKSMVNRVLGTKPENALNGTTVLNTIALLKGVSILRVHDVKEAVEAVKLCQLAN